MILEIIFISATISFLVLWFGMFLIKKGIIKSNKFMKDDDNNHVPDVVDETIDKVKSKIKKKK